nr:helix-turn-helix transcriptional regulator [Arthrobacter wenxiniae]
MGVRAPGALRSVQAEDPTVRQPPALLTRRERQVSTLAAAGRSDREIAAELTLSLRTVEGHLYRAYAKLGISSREDLPEAMANTAAG